MLVRKVVGCLAKRRFVGTNQNVQNFLECQLPAQLPYNQQQKKDTLVDTSFLESFNTQANLNLVQRTFPITKALI